MSAVLLFIVQQKLSSQYYMFHDCLLWQKNLKTDTIFTPTS